MDDDRVLAADFENRALDPDLPRRLVGGDFVDPQSYFARTRKGDVASLGMGHNRVPKACARPGAEVDDALGHTGFLEQFDKFRSDSRRVARWFQNHGVAGNYRSQRHPSHNRARKVPWRNHRAYAQRNVQQGVMLAGHLHRELSLGEPQCFPAVVFAKIDGLGDVRVCLCPILANLKYHPGAKLELALAQQIAYAEQKAGTLLE